MSETRKDPKAYKRQQDRISAAWPRVQQICGEARRFTAELDSVL